MDLTIKSFQLQYVIEFPIYLFLFPTQSLVFSFFQAYQSAVETKTFLYIINEGYSFYMHEDITIDVLDKAG